MSRITCALALLLALTLPASASPMRLLGTADSSSWPVLLMGAPASEAPLDQRAIYDILCGGRSVTDPELRAHLWKVAGSLATKSWVPPKVTIRVVVQPAR